MKSTISEIEWEAIRRLDHAELNTLIAEVSSYGWARAKVMLDSKIQSMRLLSPDLDFNDAQEVINQSYESLRRRD